MAIYNRRPLEDAEMNIYGSYNQDRSNGNRPTAARSWVPKNSLGFNWSRKSSIELGPNQSQVQISPIRAMTEHQTKTQPKAQKVNRAEKSSSSECPTGPVYVVVMAPIKTTIADVMAQIRGGPSREIHILSTKPLLVYVEFVYPYHANSFQEQVRKGQCYVKGDTLMWCRKEIAAMLSSATDSRLMDRFERISRQNHEYLSSEYQKHKKSSKKEWKILATTAEEKRKATRIIEMKQPSECPNHLVQVDCRPEYLLRIFSMFGEVLCVRPMFIRKHVAFAIEYSSLNEATHAFETFQYETLFIREIRQRNPALNKFAGLHSWKSSFAPDPAEKFVYF